MLNQNKIRLSCLNQNKTEACNKIIENFADYGIKKICPTKKLTCNKYFELVDKFYNSNCLKLDKKNK